MTNDSFPFPSPSKAPDTVTETDDTINPILMSLSASRLAGLSQDFL